MKGAANSGSLSTSHWDSCKPMGAQPCLPAPGGASGTCVSTAQSAPLLGGLEGKALSRASPAGRQTDRQTAAPWEGEAQWHSLGLVFGALQVCMVLLYGVQGDVADVAGVAALQACEEKQVLINSLTLGSTWATWRCTGEERLHHRETPWATDCSKWLLGSTTK